MTDENLPMRRKFAAKYSSKWQAWVAFFLGLSALSGLSEKFNPISFIFAVALLGFSIYLFRGKGMSPKALERSEKRALKLQSKIDDAKSTLVSSKGGKRVVAYRNLENVLKSTKAPDYSTQFEAILQEINFEKKSIESTSIGSIPKLGILNRDKIEVYRDWIICGQEAYDVDSSTRGEVHIDGSIQFDAKNRKRDNRKANVQFVSQTWSQIFPIDPDNVNQARLVVSQLSAVVDSLKPSGVTTADISKMIETILNNSGQPPAEKLQQLSELRYQRLLTDQEFEAAKAKVLGI